jgi:FtsH-binding integral membrane protein
MKRRWLQIRRSHRLLLYGVSLALFLSGVGWAWIQHLDRLGRASDTLLQIKTKLIAVHGFSAMFFVFLLGTLLVGHVRRAWHARKNRANGTFFLAAVSLLTLSGYALYYLGDEHWRAATSAFHLWLGVAAPALLILHVCFGRRATRS